MNSESNIPKSIHEKIGRNLHQSDSHPIGIIKNLIYDYFDNCKEEKFIKYDSLEPMVTVENNFDLLLIPKNHPARSKSDTYYVDSETVLRTHTSAHQNDLMKSGITNFLVTGDVYRKDEIDATHHPVFHQMEGVWIDMTDNEPMNDAELEKDLIQTLEGLCDVLFPGSEKRVKPDYFPFTNPSFEIEVYHNDKWIEILGCGIIEQQIIDNCSKFNQSLMLKKGWAFGLGLDRLAMILFNIPDIRYLWVTDDKFTKQFSPGTIQKFVPYPILDVIARDVSFYIPSDQIIDSIWKKENDMYETIRETANTKYQDIIAKVEMFDEYMNKKQNKLSRAYRIHYSPPDPKMNDPGKLTELVNHLHKMISDSIGNTLNVQIR